jgi:hypothetical protein
MRRGKRPRRDGKHEAAPPFDLASIGGLGVVNEAKGHGMPKILISVSERVTYSREVEMTDAEWREWNVKTEHRGRAHDDAVEDLTERYIRRASDWQDAGGLQLEDLSAVED